MERGSEAARPRRERATGDRTDVRPIAGYKIQGESSTLDRTYVRRYEAVSGPGAESSAPVCPRSDWSAARNASNLACSSAA